MYYIVETKKPFELASQDLDLAVENHQFGVLHIHDLGKTLRSKGIDFKEECRVFEVCNPKQAARVLAEDMRLNMALPCRISVYTEQGKTFIGMIKPVAMLGALTHSAALIAVANEVEATTTQIVNAAR